jgi:tetratricopeptide (TPR) repeat protein
VSRNNSQHFPAWAFGVIGAVTLLAVALLILAVVLGVRAGQQQLDMQRRQQVGIAIQQALDFRSEGNLEAALDAYQRVLVLEPGNKTAVDGIGDLLHMAAARTPNPNPPNPASQAEIQQNPDPPNPSPSTPLASAAVTATQAVVSAAAPTRGPDVTGLLRAAQTDFDAGRWQEAINQLLSIRQMNASYAPDKLNALLFKAYVNLANEKDNEDRLEEALALYNQALALRADDTTNRERDLIAKYLDAQDSEGANWAHTVELLKALYTQEPDYRDVTDRLHNALIAYGDDLANQNNRCQAAEQYAAAIAIQVTAGLITKRDQAQAQCKNGQSTTGTITNTRSTTTSVTTPSGTATATETVEEATPTQTEELANAGDKPTHGRILYSAHDSSTGHSRIMIQLVAGGAATLLRDDATQPALRPDGQRLVFRNARADMSGLSTVDPATDLLLRFTEFGEDILPSWSPQGNRVVFASNRDGDRRWRVYVIWAEANSEATKLDFGQSPEWNPTQDQIAYSGCDTSGNRCGIWTMSGSGSNHAPLTTVQSDDRPTWSPDGHFVAFMSNSRDGNSEIYRVEVSTGQVLRLTDNPAIDGLPTISPDGQWVAFVSNRDGAWKLWTVPLVGGPATLLAPINGDLGNWVEQDIQWVN